MGRMTGWVVIGSYGLVESFGDHLSVTGGLQYHHAAPLGLLKDAFNLKRIYNDIYCKKNYTKCGKSIKKHS